MKKILVIAVHPDDETLGCGGTILRHKEDGDEVNWLVVTNITNNVNIKKEVIEKRQEEINIVNKRYDFNSITKLDIPAFGLDELATGEIISKVSQVFKDIQPEVIYLQYRGDAHNGHIIVFDAVMACSKSFRYSYIKEIYAMETLSETEFSAPLMHNAFIPNHFVDITKYLDEKIDIMKVYASEIKEHPFPRSERNIRALATLRGAYAGVDSAEAFMCLKYIR